ncbi:MAG: MEDS domain-containing protein, partial [Streptosporangiaceae bacterium]
MSMTAVPTSLLPGLTHQALIYQTDEAFVTSTSAFCRNGLQQGDQVLAVTTAANIGLLRDGLGDDAAGVEFVDAAHWYDA